jgi:glycosyltransferase involved in cell wall biosynthesis
MRILYAHEGNSVYDEMFIRFLLDRGHEVHLFSVLNVTRLPSRQREQYNKLNIPGLHTYTRAFDHKNPILNVLLLTVLLHKVRPDVLVGNYLQTYAFYSSLTNYHPFVGVVWGSDVLLDPRSILGRMRAMVALAAADLVIVDSVVQKRAAISLGCKPQKIASFPWCVDLNRFYPSVKNSELREELGYADDDFVVLCNRAHERTYGLEYLIRAIPLVHQQIPKSRFLFLGQGSLTYRLMALAREMGVEAFVRFEGSVSHEEMPRYLSISDVYVSPSLSDGTSSSLLEAMACQRPVIATEIPGNLEWITNKESGLVVRPRDPGALAEAIIIFTKDTALAKSCGRQALEVVRKRANLKLSLQEFEAVLSKASRHMRE